MAIGTGLAILISSLIGAGTNFGAQQLTAHQDRVHSSAEAEKARDWQEEMRNTNYQASVDDIEKAGLNPAMLYGSSGAGLSATPSSAVGSSGSHNASMLNIAQAGELLNAITSARALDYKMHKKVTPTTREIYNASKDIFRNLN